jgi:predicted glutamine amidotransferase
VAFLGGRDGRLFREPVAVAFSFWIACLWDHPIQSDTAVAHIRHATRGGPVSLRRRVASLRTHDTALMTG